jgi:hypothetical protein
MANCATSAVDCESEGQEFGSLRVLQAARASGLAGKAKPLCFVLTDSEDFPLFRVNMKALFCLVALASREQSTASLRLARLARDGRFRGLLVGVPNPDGHCFQHQVGEVECRISRLRQQNQLR